MAMNGALHFYSTRPTASIPRPLKTLPAPVAIAAAAPADEGAALAADAAEEEGIIAILVVTLPVVPLNPSRVVHLAVKPVAFIHVGPIVLFMPETKLTGAHCRLRLEKRADRKTPHRSRLTWYRTPSTELSTT